MTSTMKLERVAHDKYRLCEYEWNIKKNVWNPSLSLRRKCERKTHLRLNNRLHRANKSCNINFVLLYIENHLARSQLSHNQIIFNFSWETFFHVAASRIMLQCELLFVTTLTSLHPRFVPLYNPFSTLTQHQIRAQANFSLSSSETTTKNSKAQLDCSSRLCTHKKRMWKSLWILKVFSKPRTIWNSMKPENFFSLSHLRRFTGGRGSSRFKVQLSINQTFCWNLNFKNFECARFAK